MRKRLLSLCVSLVAMSLPSLAQEAESADVALVGELMAFHGSRTIVSVMTTHCYETTGLDPQFKVAADDWYLRNIGFLDLADRVIARLGGAEDGQRQAAETYAGSQIMSAYNQAEDKDRFCAEFMTRVSEGGFDIREQLPETLERAQAIASQ